MIVKPNVEASTGALPTGRGVDVQEIQRSIIRRVDEPGNARDHLLHRHV